MPLRRMSHTLVGMPGLDPLSVPTQEAAGSPDLPNAGRLIELEYATMDDRKLRSQLRNVSALELQVPRSQPSSWLPRSCV